MRMNTLPLPERTSTNYVSTYTGCKFWPTNPRAKDICVEDIAHALSNICRFNGACRSFYSVAQHSVLVSENVGVSPKAQFIGLMHDAAEAYWGDRQAPVKTDLDRDIERNLMDCIFEALRVPKAWEMKSEELVKAADLRMLVTEFRDLMPRVPESLERLNPFSATIFPWPPADAEVRFLNAYALLAPRPKFTVDTAKGRKQIEAYALSKACDAQYGELLWECVQDAEAHGYDSSYCGQLTQALNTKNPLPTEITKRAEAVRARWPAETADDGDFGDPWCSK